MAATTQGIEQLSEVDLELIRRAQVVAEFIIQKNGSQYDLLDAKIGLIFTGRNEQECIAQIAEIAPGKYQSIRWGDYHWLWKEIIL